MATFKVFFGRKVVAGGGITASLSATLGALTASSTARLAIVGTSQSTLGAVTLSAGATLDIAADLSQTLGALTLSGAATSDIAGSLTATLGAATLSGATSLKIAAALSQTLGALTLSSEVNSGEPRTATLEQTLGALTLSSSASGLAVPATPSTGGGGVIVRRPRRPREPHFYTPERPPPFREIHASLRATLGEMTLSASAMMGMTRAARRRSAAEILLA